MRGLVGAEAPKHISFRTNISTMIGAWPPSDKLLADLQNKLGTTVGGGGGTPLMVAAVNEIGVRKGLQALLYKAKGKCGGSVLEGLTETLKSCAKAATEEEDEDDDDDSDAEVVTAVHEKITNNKAKQSERDEMRRRINAKGPASMQADNKSDAGSSQASVVDLTDVKLPQTAEELKEAAREAREAIFALRNEQGSLYTAAKLPDLSDFTKQKGPGDKTWAPEAWDPDRYVKPRGGEGEAAKQVPKDKAQPKERDTPPKKQKSKGKGRAAA